MPTESQGPEEDKDGLLEEAKELAGSVRRQFLLLIGTGAFMLVALDVSDETLISGQQSVTIPVLEVPASLSSLILTGPILLAGLLCYMHLLLGRLTALGARGIHPPQTDFFTIREPLPRAISDVCFYCVVPIVCGWFFIRTIFRPEAGMLMAIFCATLLVCSVSFLIRQKTGGRRGRHLVGITYVAAASVITLGSIATFAVEGRGPFQKLASAISELDLEGADLSGLASEVNFRGFSFDGQCLRNANLSGLQLAGASFVGADLSGAVLSGANLSGAILDDANLEGASLVQADMSFASVRMVAANRIDAASIILDDADLTGTRMAKASLERASMLRVKALHLNLRQSSLSGARLSGSTLDCTDLREVDGQRVLFQSIASAKAARFGDATLTRSNFNAGNFDLADFTRTDLSGGSFGGSSLQGTVLDLAITDGVKFEQANPYQPAPEGTAPHSCTIPVPAMEQSWRRACR